MIALACSESPEGRRRWTVRLLAEKAVELHLAQSVSHMTIQRILKNELKPHLRKYWKIPPEGSAAFVANMEDVIAVYHLPYDPDYPQVVWMKAVSNSLGKCTRR